VPILLALALTGCGDDGDGAANAQPTPKATVVMTEDGYQPKRVRVEVGSRVTWVNRDAAAVTAQTDGVGFFDYNRTAHDRRNVFDLHTLQVGEAESVEFDTPGTYKYYSSFNTAMRGVIEVVPKEGGK
jgi:plastocyanin